jgi:hypothetical protein
MTGIGSQDDMLYRNAAPFIVRTSTGEWREASRKTEFSG